MSHNTKMSGSSCGLRLSTVAQGHRGATCDTSIIPDSLPDSLPNSLIEPTRGDLETADVGQLLEDFRPYLLTIAEHFCPVELLSKLGHSDIVQETLVKGYLSFSTFEGSTRGELATWLRRILLNHLHNVREALQTSKRDYRREQPLLDSLVEGSHPTASQALLAQEERERFEAAFARLPERLSQVLLLRNRDRLSFAAIGDRLSLSETRSRNLWVQAVDLLRQELIRDSPRTGS